MTITVLRAEVLAAVAAVVLLAPETVAFAQIAGIPPAQGLAAAPLSPAFPEGCPSCGCLRWPWGSGCR